MRRLISIFELLLLGNYSKRVKVRGEKPFLGRPSFGAISLVQ